ncbi:uncharacterized protein BCR38DRAFT_329676 [Pseudomassariella vexata]|uniref:GDP/GTP exchange factor Sec2 N-terminal domain-containing protein n=1 Tax=Pseudomassariella vexata TaxID=1141098 RepID=A0A1Y2EI01_9PEZI|nr:uncharacterized protein BCR38DRAFT_329676 [Pseudomassariella vexata]ORY71202.1 hypothetical protein BCR38DRAFT_329676 [Pseudomassariella vexata]
MTMTLPPTISTTTSTCCPSCGFSLQSLSTTDPHAALLQAQKQIEDLQAQVGLLSQKATAAVDRWADYEDELSRLRAASTTSVATTTTSQHTPHNSTPSLPTSSPRSSFLGNSASAAAGAAASRISQLLSPRKSVPNIGTSSNRASLSSPQLTLPLGGGSGANSNDDLVEALNREQRLRKAAEGKLNDTSREVEELSATLFEQANEMVASERRARAKLEERVGILERRDEEKRARLDRLEGAMGRIERVRGLLNETKGTARETDDQHEA